MSTTHPKLNDVIYWVRSIGPGAAKDRVAMYFKGQKQRNDDEGIRGDVMARPVSLGDGEYTATYGRSDFEDEGGTALFG
jgi:hypothetical protein